MGRKGTTMTDDEIKYAKILAAMNKMSIYYIVDTENVDKSSYIDLSGIRRKDILEFMYTAHSKAISYQTLELMQKCKGEITFKSFESIPTKDLLDFKMVVEGTSIIAKSKKYFVIFISEDKGFDSAVDHINTLYGDRCVRLPKIINITSDLIKNVKTKKSETDPLKI